MSDRSDAPAIDVVSGDPTPEELAAVIALLSDAYSREVEDAVVDDAPASAWERTQRPMREPLRRDIQWGRFAG